MLEPLVPTQVDADGLIEATIAGTTGLVRLIADWDTSRIPGLHLTTHLKMITHLKKH